MFYDWFSYILIFLSSALICIIITPFGIQIGTKLNILDLPNARKVHKKAIPRTGGIAIFLSFLITYVLLEILLDPITDPIFVHLLVCCVAIFALGFCDDKYDLNAKLKFFVQIAIAIYFSIFVNSIGTIHLPFYDEPITLGYFSIPITVFWIVGITNAFNLIDGLDGLASGVATISAISYFLVSVMLGNFVVALLALVLAGSLVGFLFFNSHPAKIFLGDSGSLFIGFVMAALSVIELKQFAVITFITPLLIFFIPISDTLYAIVRRKIKGEPVFQADKFHLHHCLLAMGYSHRQTVWIIYLICSIFAIGAFVSSKLTTEISLIVLVIYILFFQFLAKKIGMIPNKKGG